MRDPQHQVIGDAEMESVLQSKWQKFLDMIREIMHVSAAIVMCAHADEIGLFAASGGEERLRITEEREPFSSYCQTVMAERRMLTVSNAMDGDQRRHCKDAKPDMIAFLGLPLLWPDGSAFGTVCVLDSRERGYSDAEQQLLGLFAGFLQDDLAALVDRDNLKKAKESINDLKAANERFVLAANAGAVGVWDWDIQHDTLNWDTELSGLYGLEPGPRMVTHADWISRVHADDAARCEGEVLAAIESHQALETEYRIVLPDGGTRYIRSCGNIICDGLGRAIRMVGINFDITDKKLAEIALKTSEERLKRAQALAHVGNWEIDLAKRQMWASQEAFRIYGLSYENGIIPLNVAQRMVIEEDRPKMDRALTGLIRGDINYDVVFQIHRQSDDEVRVLHSVAEAEYDADRSPLRVVGVVQDISDMIQAQRRISESENAYKALFNEHPAVRLVLSAEDAKIIDLNPSAAEFYGYTREELIGKSVSELNGQPLETAVNNLRMAYQVKKTRFEASHRMADGSWRQVEAFTGPVEIDGRPCVNCIIHDITDRKTAEAQLRESESRFRQFVESAPDGVFVQTGGCFGYVNQKTIELLGAESADQLLGSSVPQFFTEDCRAKVIERIRTLNETRQPVPLTEEAILRMDGGRVEVEVSAVPIRHEGQDGALVFMRDITARRILENEKTQMEAQLRQKQRLESIGLLAGGVAHEINNPLNGIINYAQLISEGETEAVYEYSREIIREGQRIGAIVRNLLRFSRQEKQSHSPARIEDIVDETLSLIRTLFRHDQIGLEVNIPDGLPSIKCRSQQIQQVLMNLLTNARDALNARYKGFNADKAIRVDCRLFERAGRRWIRLTVEDYGTGIPKGIRDKIFDPFFTTKPRDEGTGLGLSISHGIVKDHHGELYFDSETGQYTRAILELPVDNGWNLTEV